MKHYCLTDKGKVRNINQDAVGIFLNLKNERLYVVCDGVGGNKAGEVASSLAVKTIGNDFERNKGFKSLTEARKYLTKVINTANTAVYGESEKDPNYKGMATTSTGLLFSKKGTLIFNVGDSRVYGFKNNELIQLTVDHSYVNELLKANLITEKQASRHPKKHMITRAVGTPDYVDVDVKLADDSFSCFLVCSDGLHGYVKKNKIEKILAADDSIEKKTYDLMNAALDEGAPDNVSIILIEGDLHE